jgi:hypothetical protein
VTSSGVETVVKAQEPHINAANNPSVNLTVQTPFHGRGTLRLIERYKRNIGGTVELHPDAPLLRKPKNGKPYDGHVYLSKRIRKAMSEAGIGAAIQARDLRRTANLERAEAGATESEQGAAGGWQIGRSPKILSTYALDLEARQERPGEAAGRKEQTLTDQKSSAQSHDLHNSRTNSSKKSVKHQRRSL